MDLNIAAEDPGIMRGRRAQRVEAPGKHLNDPAALLVEGHALDMLKQRRHLSLAIGQGDPELRAVQAAAVRCRRPLRVGDGAPEVITLTPPGRSSDSYPRLS